MAPESPVTLFRNTHQAQQAVLALHRLREQTVKMRTMQVNNLRGLLAEYGEVMPKSRAGLEKGLPDVLERLCERLPAALIDSFQEQKTDLKALDEKIGRLECRLSKWLHDDPSSKAIAEIPGVGLLTATAAVASMGDAKAVKSGREFAAFLGLVPSQKGTGGRVQLLGISKRGDTYLRTLLTHGARSVLFHAKSPGPWITGLKTRRPPNVVAVALANKMARLIWAVLAHDRPYRADHVSAAPT